MSPSHDESSQGCKFTLSLTDVFFFPSQELDNRHLIELLLTACALNALWGAQLRMRILKASDVMST